MTEDVHKHEFVDEIRICPMCGYRDGFHSMIKRDGSKVKWLFICSSCHEVFDFGFEYMR
jgi:superfamily II helicase